MKNVNNSEVFVLLSKKSAIFLLISILVICFLTPGCSGTMESTIDNLFDADGKQDQDFPAEDTKVLLENVSSGATVDYSDFDGDNSVTSSDGELVKILLDDENTKIEGDFSQVVEFIDKDNRQIINITAGGVYLLSGRLSNGQIYVNSGEAQVRLIFSDINVSCRGNAPIYLNNGKKVVITLAEGSDNFLSDTEDYSQASCETDSTTGEVSYEPNGALFSKKSLTINGSGRLTIDGNFNNGISCKDELKIIDAKVCVKAVNNGIKGNDFVALRNAEIVVDSIGDGIKSSKENNVLKGFVCIDGSNVKVTSGEDGIQAVTTVAVYDGVLSVNATLKGIKSDNAMLIAGGTAYVTSSSDDTLHSNDFIDIVGGDITLSAKDDGIHADNEICIKAGKVSVVKSYEGIEACLINVEGGNVSVVSSDDGFNASNGNGGNGGNGGMGGPGWRMDSAGSGASGGANANKTCELNISGGSVYVNASGDGLDSNGNITFTGGTTIVNGPTSGGNGILDSGDGGYQILVKGGTLIAAGTSSMLDTPSSQSTQCVVVATMSSSLNDLAIVNSDGETIVRFTPDKQYQAVIVSSPLLKVGETYGLYTGSSSGTLVAEFKVSSVLTTIGNGAGGMGGPGGMGRPGSGSGSDWPGGGRPGRW